MTYKSSLPYKLVLPAVILMLFFIGYPLVEVFRVSFTDTHLLLPRAPRFVWFTTYIDVLKDSVFIDVLINTFKWMFLGTLFTMLLSMCIGYYLSFDLKMSKLLRALIIVPWILPPVVSAASWQWMLNGTFGVINDLLMRMRIIDTGIPFLGNTTTALYALIIVLIWKNVPMASLFLSAAFQSVPKELIDAGKIDGANSWQRFWRITFPTISGIFAIVIVSVSIWCIQQFVLIWVTTQGGPVNATHILPSYIYESAFINYKMGRAGVLSVVNICMLLLISVFYLKLFKRKG